jgi:hypothetical protein
MGQADRLQEALLPPRARRLCRDITNPSGIKVRPIEMDVIGNRRPGGTQGEADMTCRAIIVALAILVMAAPPAFSGYALDLGADSCGKWSEARRVRGTLSEATHTAWVFGYLSAAAAVLEGEARAAVFLGKNNQTLIEKADILNPQRIDASAINAWLDKYCRAHPLEKIADALPVLVAELKEKTGYLLEAVCETSDLEEEGRGRCRKALEETKRSAVTTLDDGTTGSLNGKIHRPRPAGPARSPQGQPIVGQSQTRSTTVVPPAVPGRALLDHP